MIWTMGQVLMLKYTPSSLPLEGRDQDVSERSIVTSAC